ncbi:MAG: hypothetical protein RJA25_1979 [Bacteroidota bacterium]
MIKILSKTLSYLFHPLLMVTWFVLMLLYTNPFSFAGMPIGIVIAVIFINTFMFPAISVLLMKKLGFIQNLEMPDHKQRIIPLVATIIFYVWAYLAIKKINFPLTVRVFMLGTLASLFIAFLINVFSKISLHMVGMGGIFMGTLFLSLISPTDIRYFFVAIIVLTGAIASARLYLEAHTMKEVYTGLLVGVFGQLIGLILSFF